MAGEWIKVEVATADKPEVLRIARILKIDQDAAFGKLIRLWSWMDANSVDGVVDGVVDADVDRLCHCTGFTEACVSVGWLYYDAEAERMTLPNFDRHNGETAKKRASKNRRQAKWRAGVDGSVDTKASTGATTREEKRREEKKEQKQTPAGADLFPDVSPQVLSDFRKLRAAKKAAITQTAVDGIRREATKAGLTLEAALAMCCERGWTGFKADWVVGSAGSAAVSVPGGGRRAL